MPRANKSGVRGLYRDTSGQLWIDLRWRDPKTGKRQRYRERLPKSTAMAAAKRRATEILSAALAGTFDPNRKPPRKLRAAFDGYLEWLETERPKAVRDRRFHSNALVASLGDVALDDLSAFGVERFKRDRRNAGREPATVNRHLATLKHFIRRAAAWGWVGEDVAAGIRAVKLLREPPGRVRYLTPDEETKLLAALPPELVPIVWTAVLSGMRRSEVTDLRWSAVDLANGSITLTRTKSNRVRRIPIHPELRPVLEALGAAQDPTAYVFPLPSLPAASERVKRSEAVRRRAFVSKRFRLAVADAKIDDLRLHDLRHDFATRLRRSGAGIDAIAKLLGHSSLAMANRYAHLEDDVLRAAVAGARGPTSGLESADDGGPADSKGLRTSGT